MRMASLALVLAVLTVSAGAQQRPIAPIDQAPRETLTFGFDHAQANAPPGVCNCFGLNGGFVETAVRIDNTVSAVGEGTFSHANDISALGQNLTLSTFEVGPRVTLRGHTLAPFGQALFGVAHGADSFFPEGGTFATSATSFGYSLGGGVDVNLTRRFAIRALQAEFTHTSFPNGTVNDDQRHLFIGAGISTHWGGTRQSEYAEAAPAPPPQPRSDIYLSCSENATHVERGETVEILGNTMTEPDRIDVRYSWTASAGTVEGSGREVHLETADLAPGRYVVNGHAQAVNDANLAANCTVAFEVKPTPMPMPEPMAAPAPAVDARNDAVFHENVRDALFDYNSAAIRPDTQAAIDHAAWFLKENPGIRVLVGGFADERGTIEYNLDLGVERAEAARDALIHDGVQANRIQIISYGKLAQVCTTTDEECYQLNRRAAFSLHP